MVNVGDKVKIIRDTVSHRIPLGNIVTITKSDTNNFLQDFNDCYVERRDFLVIEGQEAEGDKIQEKEFNCTRCGDLLPSYKATTNMEGDIYCQHCYSEKYFNCGDCNKETERDTSYHVGGRFDVCADCFGNYSDCANCGRLSNDLDDDNNCENCDENTGSDGGERKYDKGDTYSMEKGRAYAVEIECNYPNVAARRGLFSLPREIGITRDGSLGSKGVELQTPKLTGKKGEDLLKEICAHLLKNKFTVDAQCGLHVHLDTADFFKGKKKSLDEIRREYFRFGPTVPDRELLRIQKQITDKEILQNIKTLFLFYIAFEPVIYSVLPMSRRTSRYCYPLTEFYHMKEIEETDTLEKLEFIWYREQSKASIDNRKKDKYDHSRYSGFNFHSMLANAHIESRHHSGTLDFIKIKNWVEFNIIILDNVMNGRIKISELKTINKVLELSQKTKLMYEMLGLPKTMQKYFNARQKKFCEGTVDKQTKCAE